MKVDTTTPEKRFIIKKFDKMIKTIKNKDQYMFSLTEGYLSILTESIALFITSIHPSVVDI